MAITYIGEAGVAGGNQTTPQVIHYASTAGNTLILSGFLYFATATVPGVSSITDSAGNTWHYSTNTSQNPPYFVDTTASSGNSIGFVAWCINAAAVTTVTLAMVNSSPWTRVTVSEWSGIGAVDSSASAAALTGTSPTATVHLSSDGDLVVGTCENNNNAPINPPANWTEFTSSGSVANNVYYFPGITGNYSPAWTLGASADWGVALTAFKPKGGANALLAGFP